MSLVVLACSIVGVWGLYLVDILVFIVHPRLAILCVYIPDKDTLLRKIELANTLVLIKKYFFRRRFNKILYMIVEKYRETNKGDKDRYIL